MNVGDCFAKKRLAMTHSLRFTLYVILHLRQVAFDIGGGGGDGPGDDAPTETANEQGEDNAEEISGHSAAHDADDRQGHAQRSGNDTYFYGCAQLFPVHKITMIRDW